MNKALPKIKETSEELREMLKKEFQSKRQNRLQVLYLIVTKQAKSRSKGRDVGQKSQYHLRLDEFV